MRLCKLILISVCAVMALDVATPAFAHDPWHPHDRYAREAWREREWRRHVWRERAWLERYYPPPVVAAPPYGYYGRPPGYYPYRGYYR